MGRVMMRRQCRWMGIGMNLALVIAPVMLFSGCSGSNDQPDESQMVAEVSVTKVTRTNIQQSVTVSGNVVALHNKDVKVSALVPGRITGLNVAEGDRVRAGSAGHDRQPHLRGPIAAIRGGALA